MAPLHCCATFGVDDCSATDGGFRGWFHGVLQGLFVWWFWRCRRLCANVVRVDSESCGQARAQR